MGLVMEGFFFFFFFFPVVVCGHDFGSAWVVGHRSTGYVCVMGLVHRSGLMGFGLV